MRQHHPFAPIVNDDSTVLILGSFPSIASFEQRFYYAHPRNQFWPIFETLFDVELKDNTQRRAFLLDRGIALWDVYASLTRARNNSSDSNLVDMAPNDLAGLLKRYPHINTLFCTGTKAYDGYRKHFSALPVQCRKLPSPSPAYAAMPLSKKIEAYAAVKEALNAD